MPYAQIHQKTHSILDIQNDSINQAINVFTDIQSIYSKKLIEILRQNLTFVNSLALHTTLEIKEICLTNMLLFCHEEGPAFVEVVAKGHACMN
jgi:hypothetical protein